MKLTIIRDMGLVHVDGTGYDELDMSSVPVEIHAVQWNGTEGEIEYVSNDVPNEYITALPSWVDAPIAARQAKIDEEAIAEAEAEAYAASDEGKAEAIRVKRDSLIAETDWWASSDLTMTQEQSDYRQALRDITLQEGFPQSINWPIKP